MRERDDRRPAMDAEAVGWTAPRATSTAKVASGQWGPNRLLAET